MKINAPLLSIISMTAMSFVASAIPINDNTYLEDNGLVIMEAENTHSRLRRWVQLTEIPDYTGSGHLEFTANNPFNGDPHSPLEYTFHITKPGLYYLHLRCARETVHGRDDLANDAYVRVEGDYSAGPASDARNATLETLTSDTKHFGGDHNAWVWTSGPRLDLGGHNNKRIAVYDFKAGETYRLVVSGRSKFFKLDRIMFRHADVSMRKARKTSNPESQTHTEDFGPGIDLNTPIRSTMFDGESHPDNDTFVKVSGGRVVRNYNGNWISFYEFDFGNGDFSSISIDAASARAGGNIEVRVGSPTGDSPSESTLLGTISISNTGGWSSFETFSTDLATTTGIKNLYFVYSGPAGRLFNLKAFIIR